MTTTINVGIIGFSAREENQLKKIFALSPQHSRQYKLTNLADLEPVELLIVKKSDKSTLQQQVYQARYKNNPVPIVTVGKELALNQDAQYISGVLVPSRVLSVLNSVEIVLPTENVMVAPAENLAIKPSDRIEIPAIEEVAAIADTLQVLVIDDSLMMQKTVAAELKQVPIPLAVDFAETGELALEKIKLQKYDFIFLDVMMPGIDGFETCSEIRKLEGMAKTPIIMLTAKNSALDEVKGLMAGCTTYLTKPFVHDDFHKMLERIMHWIREFNDGK